ncbi:MAG: DUF1624 domain-containing protein [Acidobacteriaceae bacterium]|nr:DUF1624 domain-containing protein [Acidobacteriaceae bacterium]
MIIMALDHVRDFTNSAAASFAPEDLSRTTAAIFLTRWITHFCAPVFMFSAGLGAYFWKQHGHNNAALSRFLATRGLWLVVLEFTIMQFALTFRADYALVIANVLWALGASMIALAVICWLPVSVISFLALAMIGLHNLADKVSNPSLLWAVLHRQAAFPFQGHALVIAYPLVPWIGVMALGYCFGALMQLDADQRRQFLIRSGLAITAAFLLVRGLNVYGDPTPWTTQRSPLFTVLSFLNTAKYPPSLDFLLMTLGPAILALGLLDRVRLSASNPVVVFGRVPLFYYMGHFYLAHLLAFGLAYARYGMPGLLNPPAAIGGARQPVPAYGFDLWVTYLVWITVVVIMYPVCRWYAGVKQRRRDWWLSYL